MQVCHQVTLVDNPQVVLVFNLGFTRKDDVPLTTYIGERKSNTRHATRIDNKQEARNEEGERAKKEKGAENEKESKINDDPIQESELDGLKITLFFEPEVIPSKLEGSGSNGEGSDNAEGPHPDFMTYTPPLHKINVDHNARGG